MKKQETLKHIKDKMGYIPYSTIFDIFLDDDEIPEGLIKMSCREPKPNGDFIICSAKLVEELEKISIWKNRYIK